MASILLGSEKEERTPSGEVEEQHAGLPALLGEMSTVEEVEEHAATAYSSDRAEDEGISETAVAGGEDLIGDLPEDGSSSGAHNLFDAMPDQADDEGNTERAVAGGEDRIGALPDDVLSYLMSFLLSREAVRTCVLAKRWRTLWKSVPALRIEDPESNEGAHRLNVFVDQLIRLRDPAPLNVCDINFAFYEDLKAAYSSDFDMRLLDRSSEEFRRMEAWLQYALSCQVEVLRVRFPDWVTDTTLITFFDNDMTLISSHLKMLEFDKIRFGGCSLDFSSCQVLEVLELNNCQIFGNISSKSLQHLKISGSHFRYYGRIHIFAPNLIGFRLAAFRGLAPFLDSMPSLVTASIGLGGGCIDCCSCGNRSCEGCDVRTGNNECSVVVKSLSGAVNLELTTTEEPNPVPFPRLGVARSESSKSFVFRNYLKCYPFFGKLKTLLLNEWCTVDNFAALVYFLHHSPILETLTLQLGFQIQEEQHVIEREEIYNSSVPSIISKHLKVVKIICNTEEDARIPDIVKILRTHGVPSEQIDIQ